MIRNISIDELQYLLPMAAEFHARSGIPGSFNSQSFMNTWTALMNAGIGTISTRYVDGVPVEAIGHIVTNDMLTGDRVSHVLFWMFEERESMASGILYRKVIGIAKTGGSRRIAFQVPERSCRSVRFKQLLERSGFDRIETIHNLELWQKQQQ